MSYYPKRPVKSFQDLEIYQKALAICVAVVKRTTVPLPTLPEVAKQVPAEVEVREIINSLHQCILSLPVLIATAHSLRFSDHEQALTKLEEAMLNCNLAVVYLEQFRDLADHKIEAEFFNEQIKNLLSVRMKTMHLQRSWKRFFEKK